MSKIEQTIEDMQAYFRECKSPTFSGAGKIICEKNVIDEFIEELILSTPEEIKKYQKIISQKDAILGDAKSQSAAMVAEAQRQTQKMIDEHEIMQKAYEQAQKLVDTAREDAQRIVDAATEDGNNIRLSAIQYTDNLLADLQSVVENAIAVQKERHAQLVGNLQDISETVAHNRRELSPSQVTPEVETTSSFADTSNGLDIIGNDDIEPSDIFLKSDSEA